MHKGLVVIAGIILSGCTHFTDVPEPSDTIVQPAIIDAELQKMVDDGTVAGISALVFEDGKEAYFGSFGMADREAGTPMQRDTIVQIFSMTKPVVGTAIMQMYEAGHFELDDPIGIHVPELANLKVYAGMDEAGEPILVAPDRAPTVRDFLMHTAGLTSVGFGDEYVDTLYQEIDPTNMDNTLTQVAENLAKVPLNYQPGTQWMYSASVEVQALMVERMSGQPFDEYLDEHIFGPLGMVDTGYTLDDAARARLAAAYTPGDDGVLQRIPDEDARGAYAKDWALTPGSTGLVSTLDDYMRLTRMYLNDGTLDGAQILKPETVKLMRTNYLPDSVTDRMWLMSKGQVGFGLDFTVRLREPGADHEMYGTVGEFFWDGWPSTLFWMDPANDLTSVMFVQHIPFKGEIHYRFRNAVYNVVERGETAAE